MKARKIKSGIKAHPAIKNVIAVASGKGGVGKSTTAVNVALALQQLGHRVGVLDADIYGPNIPHMLGAQGGLDRPPEKDQLIEPLVLHDLQVMSIAAMIDPADPVIWRGPMVSGALLQLFNQTQWQSLDVLVIDLPPGTGDIQLTLAKKIPVTGAVVVSTPQDIALLDARKAYAMFEKLSIPVFGWVENMSKHVCTSCGHESFPFGEAGAKTMAEALGCPLLGQLPLDMAVRAGCDAGKPIVLADTDHVATKTYHQIAAQLVAALDALPVNHDINMPGVVLE